MDKYQFQTESRQLLELMIHSIYSNKEIFLRELISNSSDALDKFRFECITKPELACQGEKPEIRIEADTEKREIRIIDNGIGMNKDELISNIGTIARSGTQEFIKKLKENKSDSNFNDMIGQFGVGFYSAFMVSDEISILTRKAGEDAAYLWVSDGSGGYSIEDSEKSAHGTDITLKLKKADPENGVDDFTQFYVISRIIKKYSDFINYPIIMKQERDEIEKDADGKPVKDGKTTKIIEDKTLNSMKPIWVRPQSEVTKEEYFEFYKHLSHDWNEPIKTIYYKAEGTSEFYSLLFIPSKAPFDFYYREHKSGLQLYVKKVLILEAFEDLLPRYFRFVQGVVESNDLPLNISREILQQDRLVAQIKKSLTKKIIDSLSELLNSERDKYISFHKEFGTAIREGASSDFENREKLMQLLLFQSSEDPEKLTTLEEYLVRMKSSQENIYFIHAESRDIAENSPHYEALKEKGYEVLFFLEPMDEIMTQYVTEFKGKKLKSITKGELDIDSKKEKEAKEKEIKEKETEMGGFLKNIQAALSERVKEVRITKRLVSAPACITGSDLDVSPYLEKLLNKENPDKELSKKNLELNPANPIVEKLFDRFKNDENDPVIRDYAELLLDYAILAEGGTLPDQVKFNKLVLSLMEKNIM